MSRKAESPSAWRRKRGKRADASALAVGLSSLVFVAVAVEKLIKRARFAQNKKDGNTVRRATADQNGLRVVSATDGTDDGGDRADSTASLHRVLGLVEVTAGGIGIIIGAGIYVLLGAATAEAGPLVWVAFLVAAILSGLTGLSYAELSSMFPSAAGEYEYTRHAMREWLAFVVGWTMIVGLIVASATIAIGFGRYVGYFVDIDIRLASLALLVLVSVVAMLGIKQSARLTVGLSAVQVGGLVFVAAIGLPHVGDVHLVSGPPVGRVLAGAALVFFAFIGFDEVITLAEETRDPTRTVPRALLLALGLSTALYVAVAIAAVSVLGAGALAASPRPLADVMAHVLGDRGAIVVAAIAVLTTTNTTLLTVTAASRVMYGMAKGGAMPRAFAIVHPVRRTPILAITAVTGIAIVFAALGDFAIIAAVTDFAVYVVFLAVNATVIILRRTHPMIRRPFAVRGTIRGVPVLPILGLASVALMMVHLEPFAITVGTAACAIGLVVGWQLRSRR
jgi:basic amino acid/polyamine antiporter, APA family